MEGFLMQTYNKLLSEIVSSKDLLLQKAKQGYPYEVGGFLIQDSSTKELKLLPCQNTVEAYGQEPIDYYVLDSQAFVEAEKQGTIVAIYHTHPMSPVVPSQADLIACVHSNTNMVIINPLTEHLSLTTPEAAQLQLQQPQTTVDPKDTILNRDFVWGVHDCYGLVQDVYKAYLGIELPHFDRGVIFAWDVDPSWNKFVDNFDKAGFVEYPVPRDNLSLIEPFDIALMAVGGKYPIINHCAVIMPSNAPWSKNYPLFWHHLYARKSREDVFKDYWVNCTYKMLRHKSRL